MQSWVRDYSDEQARTLVNLRARYEALIEAERDLARLPYNLIRKRIGEREYLYEVIDRANNGKSLGRMSPDQEARLADYQARKRDLQHRRKTAQDLVRESGRMSRPLQLPMLSSPAGELLREIDRRGLLGGTLLVVGTNCMPAYALEAGGAISGAPDETDDFDLAWVSEHLSEEAALWDALKAADPTFSVNTEREFQARNARAYEVELLVAPSRVATMHRREKPRPIPLPEQEWLLPGRRVDQVVPCRDGTAARLVVPDPRWFALHKLWLAKKPTRPALKRSKDEKQGWALLGAIAQAMPHYPLDNSFVAELPEELMPMWQDWQASRKK